VVIPAPILHLAQHLLHTVAVVVLALAQAQQHLVVEVAVVLHPMAVVAMVLQHRPVWAVQLDTEMQVVPVQHHNQEQAVAVQAVQV
jgi:hypothetical protein